VKNSWLQKRQHVLIRDLAADFIDSMIYCDKLLNLYAQKDKLPYKKIEIWVGSENRKGPLWTMKDMSHRLFRNSGTRRNLCEYLFDWTIGSIFHEAIKLKEDVYQINAYQPLLDRVLKNSARDKKVKKRIQENFVLMEKVGHDIGKKLSGIANLFDKAAGYLYEIFIVHKDNALLVKYLIDHKRLIERVYTAGAPACIFDKMFADGRQEALLFVAHKLAAAGRQDLSQKYLKKTNRKSRKTGVK